VKRLASTIPLLLATVACRPFNGPADPAASQVGSSQPGSSEAHPGGVRTAPAEGPAADAPHEQARLERPAEPLNVLLIVIDGMRADMPWEGYSRPVAPNLSNLQKHSVTFSRAYSVSSYTAKSVGAILASQYPSALFRSGHFFTLFPPSNLFFPELLQQAKVHTFSVQVGTYLRPGTGLDQGFDIWAIPAGIPGNPRSDQYITSDKLTLKAIELLQESPPDQLRFMYLHYMDTHEPYLRHSIAPDWGHSSRDRYDQEIWFTDYWVGELLTFCRQQTWWDKTAVIVTADHGEAFGEHARYKHGFALWEVLVRVPLLFHVPGAAPAQVAERRSHIDLAPTILDLMGVAIPKSFVGKSLVPEIFGKAEPPRPILLDLPADTNNPELRALIDHGLKLIINGEDLHFQLYDLEADPGEQTDIKATEPEKYEAMKEEYRRLWQAVPVIQAYGGAQLSNGRIANGPEK